MHQSGDVVELVDTLGLEPSAARRGGSTPSIPTILEQASLQIHFYIYTTMAMNKYLTQERRASAI